MRSAVRLRLSPPLCKIAFSKYSSKVFVLVSSRKNQGQGWHSPKKIPIFFGIRRKLTQTGVDELCSYTQVSDNFRRGRVAELVYAYGSEPYEIYLLEVQVLSRPPKRLFGNKKSFLFDFAAHKGIESDIPSPRQGAHMNERRRLHLVPSGSPRIRTFTTEDRQWLQQVMQ